MSKIETSTWLEIGPAARSLGLRYETLRRALHRGDVEGIRTIRVGSKWLLNAEDVRGRTNGNGGKP